MGLKLLKTSPVALTELLMPLNCVYIAESPNCKRPKLARGITYNTRIGSDSVFPRSS